MKTITSNATLALLLVLLAGCADDPLLPLPPLPPFSGEGEDDYQRDDDDLYEIQVTVENATDATIGVQRSIWDGEQTTIAPGASSTTAVKVWDDATSGSFSVTFPHLVGFTLGSQRLNDVLRESELRWRGNFSGDHTFAVPAALRDAVRVYGNEQEVARLLVLDEAPMTIRNGSVYLFAVPEDTALYLDSPLYGSEVDAPRPTDSFIEGDRLFRRLRPEQLPNQSVTVQRDGPQEVHVVCKVQGCTIE